MGPAPRFNCLWCGRPHDPRSRDDLEVYARLCSDCLGRAQDNEFLRFRLRQGLKARAGATAASEEQRPTSDPGADREELAAYYAARAPEYDDYYAGLGRSPLDRAVFQADLDAATLWLDNLALGGEIVELAAGTGWWSPLLAQKGELSLYDINEQPLDRARERLLAHGLRAHIHVRDAWSEPDRQVDAVFTGFWLSHIRRERLGEFLGLVRRWLKPGGTFAFIDEAPGPGYTQTVDDRQPRRTADGREFTITKVYYPPEELRSALLATGFGEVDVSTTARHFVLGRAMA